MLYAALASQHILDTEEEDDEDDTMPYDEYSKPDPVTVKQKSIKRVEAVQQEPQTESENQKLLEDVLVNLSDEEPSPEQELTSESESDKGSEEKSSSPKLAKIWPPPPVVEQQERPPEIKTKRTEASVLRKWQVAAAKEEKTEAKPVEKPKVRGLSKKWPPEPTETEEPTVTQKWPPAPKPEEAIPQSKPPEREPTPPPPVEPEPEKPPPLVVSLRPVKRQEAPSKQPETQKTEISTIKLKKASDKQVSIPALIVALFT